MDATFLILLLSVFIETSALFVLFLKSGNFRNGAILKENSRKASKIRRKIFIDTSTLIDGRILPVARTGFISDDLLIPRSVVRELQLLADNSDNEKRTRGRFGLDIVNELKNIENLSVEIYQDDASRAKVDERLIELSLQEGASLMTVDYNLIKVAQTENIETININDLAQGLRSEYLPGEKLRVKIIGTGANPKQGVAYLPDGTMVVVEDAERYAKNNQEIDIEFERYLQTSAGKMMFAKIDKDTSRIQQKTLPKNTSKTQSRRQSKTKSGLRNRSKGRMRRNIKRS